VSVASSAARPRTEQRSEVGAQHRPPPYEPPAGSACRDARKRPLASVCKGPRLCENAAEPTRGRQVEA